jgi:hypothetical protein
VRDHFERRTPSRGAFVGPVAILQAAQFAVLGAAAATCTEANTGPIGTGPSRDDSVNDV